MYVSPRANRRAAARARRDRSMPPVRRLALLAGACAAVLTVSACGKKGPPLPPFVRVPEAVSQVAARRVGDDVFLSFTLPARNIDESEPVALDRVDVYGYTGSVPPPAPRFTEVATLVETVKGPGVGARTVRDELTPDELLPGRPLAAALRTTTAAPVTAPAGPLKRFYLIVPFSERGRPGPPSAIIELPLTTAPDAPVDLQATYTAQAATVAWEPSGGIVGFLLDLAPPPTAAPLDDGAVPVDASRLPSGPTRYNVYREVDADTTKAPVGDASATPETVAPLPLNKTPLDALTFVDPIEIDGRRRCYTVTAIRGTGDRAIEGRPSDPVCLLPLDTFPPARPAGLSPIAVEGAISLVWEANTEADLGGYLVLRKGPGEDQLRPLTDLPIAETRFTDRTVVAGQRYEYAIVAVDSRAPQPNRSEESEHVEIDAQ